MTKNEDAANPCIESINHNGVIEITTAEAGLTKREYFAAMALQGFLSNSYWVEIAQQPVTGNSNDDKISERAVKIADELIKALNK